MLRYTTYPIHTPLTELLTLTEGERKEEKLTVTQVAERKQRSEKALELFNNILIFQHPEKDVKIKPEQVAFKILQMTVPETNVWLRNEAYCQVMKQLNGVSNGDIRTKGWKLMGLFLRYFAPVGVDMECVVETFLMKHGARQMRNQLHSLIFGALSAMPLPEAGGMLEIINAIQPPDIQGWEYALTKKDDIQKLRYCF
eukprot:TRINITY_DN4387_c0_g1_i5.p1 TRINITY_DN4387_c0_g1~~TRINITY_DN4387_c0_g1_i5.p1  ORF type:complete len:198 (+),score=24.49 TRINITY_DN4387_c0_g1_i5:145-738(+)